MERTRRLAPGKGRVGRPRTIESRFGKQRDDGVDLRVHRLDAVEEPRHERLGTQLALDEPAYQVAGGGKDDLGV